MLEPYKTNSSRSRFLLIIGILAAIAIVLWIILSFDDQPGKDDGIGQRKVQKIMVARLPDVSFDKI